MFDFLVDIFARIEVPGYVDFQRQKVAVSRLKVREAAETQI